MEGGLSFRSSPVYSLHAPARICRMVCFDKAAGIRGSRRTRPGAGKSFCPPMRQILDL